MKKVTACLISYKRRSNVPLIVESLQKWSFIGQISILDNLNGENLLCYGRYIQAQQAQYDLIYTQDDDCIVENLDEVYEKFISDETKICHSGTVSYQEQIQENIYGDSQMAMAGWGSFFKKEWVSILDQYIKKYGKDYCLLRESDRIFSILLKKHHNFVLGDIRHLSPEEESLASQEEHLKYKKLAIERALSLC